MPPKGARPPKKGSKAAADLKEKKLAQKASKDDLKAAGDEGGQEGARHH